MPLLVVAGAILLIALWAILDHNRKMAGAGSPEARALVAELASRVETLEAERERLVKRIENLEAIAVDEPAPDPLAGGFGAETPPRSSPARRRDTS